MIELVPLQNVPRLEASTDIEVLNGIASRVIFLGCEHASASQALGNAGSANRPAGSRGRHSIYHAINVEGIVAQIMRGQAQLAGLLMVPGIEGHKVEGDIRLPLDIDG